MFTNYWIIFYGLLTLIGGIIGFVTKKSKPSLVAGSLFGIIIILSGFISFQENILGYYVALFSAIFLTISFGIRYAKTRKIMPAGIMIGAGLLSIAVIAMKLLS